jgi:hypothetical protein
VEMKNLNIMKKIIRFPLRSFVIVFLSISVFALSSCINGLNYEKGNGKIIKQDRTLSPFSSIEISGAYSVYVKQDSIQSVSVEADENLLPLITTKVENNKLVIDNKKNIHGSKDLKIYISVAECDDISISGDVEFNSDGKIKAKEMDVDISGMGNLNMIVELQSLSIECSGSGNLNLSGTAENVNADLSGASDISAYYLLTKYFKLSSSGAGKANINVSEKLDIDISGASTVNYKGNPSINQNISGVGKVRKAG